MVYFCCVYGASISPLRHGRRVTSSQWNWPDPNLHQRTRSLFETLCKTVLTWTILMQSASISLKCTGIKCLPSNRHFLWFYILTLRIQLNWKDNATNSQRNFSSQNFIYWYSLLTCKVSDHSSLSWMMCLLYQFHCTLRKATDLATVQHKSWAIGLLIEK